MSRPADVPAKAARCNYCPEPAVVWLRLRGYRPRSRRTGRGGPTTLWLSACAEHEGCDNWKGHQKNQPDAPVYRAEATL